MKKITTKDTLSDIIIITLISLILFGTFRIFYYMHPLVLSIKDYNNLVALLGGLIIGILYLIIKWSLDKA